MFSPRTHRRQNSAETSYQKGKSPSSLPTVFFSLPRFIHCCYRRRGNFLAATARRGTKLFDVFSFFLYLLLRNAKRNDLPYVSSMNPIRNNSVHEWFLSNGVSFPNFPVLLFLPMYACDELHFRIVSESERS